MAAPAATPEKKFRKPDTRNLTDHELIDRYLDQPTRLPAAIRAAIEARWDGEPVQLYALCDLDASLKIARTWLAIGPHHIATVRDAGDGLPMGELVSVPRTRLTAVREAPGLSCTTLTLMAGANDPPAFVLRYTHRQQRAVETIKFLVEQQIAGHAIDTDRAADDVYAEALTHPVREAQAAIAGNQMAVVWRLLSYLHPYRRRVFWGMMAAVAFSLLQLVPPFLSGHIIDSIFKPYQAGTLSRDEAMRQGFVVLVLLASTFAVYEIFSYIRLRVMSVLGEYVARDLRDQLYEHIQRLSVSFFSKKRTGSIISRVSSDTDRLWDFVAFGVVEVSLALIRLAAISGVLLYLDWRLGLIMVLPAPLLIYAIFRHGRYMEQMFLRCWRKWSDMTDVLSDTIPGIRVVKAFNQEQRETQRFSQRNDTFTVEAEAVHRTWTLFWPSLVMGYHCMVIAVWFFAVPRVLAPGETALSVGTFVSFLLYVTMFLQPIDVIGQIARMLNRATSSAHRIFEVLDTEPPKAHEVATRTLDPIEGRVMFENVTFAYDGVRQVIKGISFDVAPGEMIGLVGPSGAGKSTIINLLVRFYETTGGTIRIDGVDLKELEVGAYRRQVGMVLQDPYLFHGTVLENICYGVPEATLADVIEAARAANAHDFICKLPHGYDTLVGERGQTLSGGERQRLSIARALLANPRILILDEATSSVDTETERKIQGALDRLIAGRTVFAIAHRLSTLTKATRLFVIEEGRLTEVGTHAELLEKENGTYRKLHRLQQELHEIYAV